MFPKASRAVTVTEAGCPATLVTGAVTANRAAGAGVTVTTSLMLPSVAEVAVTVCVPRVDRTMLNVCVPASAPENVYDQPNGWAGSLVVIVTVPANVVVGFPLASTAVTVTGSASPAAAVGGTVSCIPDATGTPVIPSSALIWTLRFVPEVLAMSEDPSPLKSPTMVVLPAPPAARTAAANVPS